jgi:glycosyltransferase involved in cell wall biosynthesis
MTAHEMPKTDEYGRTAYVHLPYGLDADRYHARFLAGLEPDESPYGFHVARELGWQIVFSSDRREGPVRRTIRRGLKWVLGFDFIHLWRNRALLRDADIVWTMQDSEWLALRFAALWHKPARLPVIGNTVWLFDRWEQINPGRRWLYQRLARGPGVLTVHSDRYVPVMQRVLSEVRCERMYFGTGLPDRVEYGGHDVEKDASRPIRVFAAGNDPTRDWATLLAAVGDDPRFEVELLCSWVSEEEKRRHPSVLPRPATKDHARETFDALYRWADLVVVPMKENRFSGITVALEAAARGRPIISSRTGGVPTYFSENEVFFVPPGDPLALRNAALASASERRVHAAAARARLVSEDYSIKGMMTRYIALSRSVLEKLHE